MISRILHIIMSLNLLVSITGFSVSLHYCEDDLVNVAIDQEATSCCDTSCGKCHNETHYFKLDENTTAPHILLSPEIAQHDLLLHEITIFDQDVQEQNFTKSYCSESPPGRGGPDLLATYQTFLL